MCDVEGKPLHDGEIIIPGKEVPVNLSLFIIIFCIIKITSFSQELTKDKRIKISEMDGKKFKYYEINVNKLTILFVYKNE